MTQRSDRSGIKCNCKKCKAMSLRTNSEAVYYNTSVWRQERNRGYINHMLGDYNYKHHEILHKINATSRGIWSDLIIRDMEAIKV